jgi:hypothetical protein
MRLTAPACVVLLSLAACGRVDDEAPSPAPPPVAQPLAQAPAPVKDRMPTARPVDETTRTLLAATPSLVSSALSVNGVAAADGQRVRFLLGVMSCGLFVAARGEATVQGGHFQLPFDTRALADWSGPVSLYIAVDADADGACGDTDTFLEVQGVTPSPGLQVDAAQAQATYAMCWAFGAE